MGDIGVYLIGFSIFMAGWFARGISARIRTRKIAKAIRAGRKGEVYRDEDIVIFVGENVSGP